MTDKERGLQKPDINEDLTIEPLSKERKLYHIEKGRPAQITTVTNEDIAEAQKDVFREGTPFLRKSRQ